ncbi:translation initiation factor IF-2 [Serratia sp. S1B]|nr:translation initiation factor IF-2 [Serratia sp. S1B]
MRTTRPIDDQDIYQQIQQEMIARTRTAAPGTIKSFDPESVTCVVSLGIKTVMPDSEQQGRKMKSVDYPLLLDLPVVFPRGGGVTLTFPIKAGDECLVVFADRCIDFWWQNGDTQERVDQRMHDLSDAFVIPGPQSQRYKISGISTRSAQLRSDDGAAFIELEPGSHAVTVTTPGKLTASAQGGTEITSPEIVLNGNVTINGNLSQGMGSSGGSATMLGPIKVTNDVTASGKSLVNHTHGGVQTGGGNTGKPQ